MPSRQEIATRKNALLDDLRRQHQEGRAEPGSVALSQRALAQRYGLSVGLVGQMLQKLIDEGVLYSVPRVGTFVGKPQGQFDVYLLTFPHSPGWDEYFSQVQIGFEERVAQLGGVSLRLTELEACELQESGQLPPLAGICHIGARKTTYDWWPQGTPRVRFGVPSDNEVGADIVRYDDIAGGRQAALHLLSMGHEKIAYLALHTSDNQPSTFVWSVDREAGWAEAMRAGGRSTEGLVFRPTAADVADPEAFVAAEVQAEAGHRIAARSLIPRREVTAVVAANVHAAVGLLRALDDARVPVTQRPAILCFDDLPSGERSVVSYLRLPWDEVGRVAAQLLWERKTGQLTGQPQERLVQMRLIPRLSCRPDWANSILVRGQVPGVALNNGQKVSEVAGV